MRTVVICMTGILLDWIFGDPVWLYHPVRIIGTCIALLEKGLRKVLGDQKNSLILGGWILWILTASLSVGIPWMILRFAKDLWPEGAFFLECFWCYQLLAARSLFSESKKVYDRLADSDISGARKAVSRIVGRDTERLTEEGVAKAGVETVAENTSDGVIAPLLYMLIGGPVLGFFYKAVNTMDSMVGYKNERYLHFGRAAAKMDDVANFIPARISAWMMILASAVLGMDYKNAFRIYRRDRKKHASPNAAQTESVCAGALGVQLAGDAYYFGKLYEKESIGDPVKKICPEDIIRAGRLMIAGEILTFMIFGGVRILL